MSRCPQFRMRWRLALCAAYTEVSMAKAHLKLSSATILSALLLVFSIGLAEPAHAGGPVIGRLQGAKHRVRQNRKPFLHPGGPNSLAHSKRQGRSGGLVSVPGL